MTLSLKTKQTNRKFYGKWLYKATLTLPGCFIFRSRTIDEIKQFCLEEDPEELRYSSYRKTHTNRERITDLCNLLDHYDKSLYQIRVERDHIDFYSNDKTFYEDVSTRFEPELKHRFEPNESTLDILNQSANFITVKKLPKNKYNYRVYLLPHKMAKDPEGKEKYVNWLKSQNPRITCSKAVERWFIKTDWNWDRRYVLVEDEATLLMLKLRNSEVVGRIYNFVLSDK